MQRSFISCLILSALLITGEGYASTAAPWQELLDLSGKVSNKTKEEYEEIAKGIKENSTLTSLNLSHNTIDWEGFETLMQAIGPHPTLRTLNLQHASLELTHAIILWKFLVENNSQLTELNLSNNRLDDAGVVDIVDFLRLNNIKHLNLSNNPIGKYNAPYFLEEGLKYSRSLEILKLSNTKITDDGLSHISNGLRYNQNFRELDISHNPLGDGAGLDIKHILFNLKDLKRIEIAKSDIFTNFEFFSLGIECVTDGLKENPTVEIFPPRAFLCNLYEATQGMQEPSTEAAQAFLTFYHEEERNFKDYLSEKEIKSLEEKKKEAEEFRPALQSEIIQPNQGEGQIIDPLQRQAEEYSSEKDIKSLEEKKKEAVNLSEKLVIQGLEYEKAQDILRAIEFYTQAAQMGHAQAQYRLGGLISSYKPIESFDLWVKAAKQKHLEARQVLKQNINRLRGYAQNYLFGDYGFPQDTNKAKEYYEIIYELDQFALAAYQLGVIYEQKKQYQEAHQWFLKVQDAPDALHTLGVHQEQGYVGLKDDGKAVEYYKKAAELGYAPSNFNLGNMYFDGRGVERNVPKAIEHWQQAAKAGYGKAMYNLANRYYMGDTEVLPQSFSEAASFYQSAAEQGLAEAQFNYGMMAYKNLTPESLGPEEIFQLIKKAADQGYEPAKIMLPSMKNQRTAPLMSQITKSKEHPGIEIEALLTKIESNIAQNIF